MTEKWNKFSENASMELSAIIYVGYAYMSISELDDIGGFQPMLCL